MEKFIFFLLISLIFNSNSSFSPHIAKKFDKLFFNQSFGCACFDLKDDIKEGYTFYLEVLSQEKEAKINKILYYNFTNFCDPNKCDENSYLYSNKMEIPNLETEENGFYYEYKFIVNDTNKQFLKVQFKDFTGRNFSMQYIPFNIGAALLTLFILFLVGIIALFIFVCCICKCVCKKKVTQENDALNNNIISSPIVPGENILNPQSQQYIELQKY